MAVKIKPSGVGKAVQSAKGGRLFVCKSAVKGKCVPVAEDRRWLEFGKKWNDPWAGKPQADVMRELRGEA